MTIPAIRIQNLNKHYTSPKKGKRPAENFHALKNLNLEVQQGEFFGYLGPNGAGKTTTISVLTGLSNFTSGKIEILGHDLVKEYQMARKNIGLAQQDLIFDPFLNLKEVLIYQAGYFGMEGKDVKARAEELLKAFDLNQHAHKTFRMISGGQKRRLQLAKAMIHDPPILILDEPTEATDTELRHALWKYFKKLNTEGKTIFLTTHYIEEAERLCDRIGIINNGELIALEDKDKLIEKMAQQFVQFKFREPVQELPVELNSYIVEMNDKGTELKLQCKNAQHELPILLQALEKAGIEVKKMNIIEDRLEDIYLKLTGGKIEELGWI